MRNNTFNLDLNFDNLGGMFNMGSSFHGMQGGMQGSKKRNSINPNVGGFGQESFLPGTSPPNRSRQSLGKSSKQQKPSGTLKQLLQGQKSNLPGSPSGLASF
eukprot:TRINITY_DN7819_c0_g1_i9.p3 TRINITY_DN7819_c0_g1~~TRINITY_DN7819_c0_g1_i9.p3  ORF type:complete len:102 (-),score=15.76 TRINITY_DN7819_c0_g1_i9:197-502(-)